VSYRRPILASVRGTPVRIALVRHGETVHNVEGRWQGQSDSPLTERGREQARRVAAALAREPVAAVYSSDLGRALATARAVAAAHGLEVGADARLREIHTGSWTGRSGAELRQEQPATMQAWRERPWALRLPGGEGLADVQARALAFCDEVLPRHTDEGSVVVLVAHGTINQALLVHALGRPLTELWLKERIGNCQISWLEWTPSTWRVVELCDARHLEGVGTLQGWRAAAD
jgi:broad specificity phosphatase PhoE